MIKDKVNTHYFVSKEWDAFNYRMPAGYSTNHENELLDKYEVKMRGYAGMICISESSRSLNRRRK